MRNGFRWLAPAVFLIVVACGGPVRIKVRGVEPMNMNESGESTPVDIRIFALADNKGFDSAKWEDLWNKDKYEDLFGQNLVEKPKDHTVFPGNDEAEAEVIDLGEMKPDVKYIGVLAMFAGGNDSDRRHVSLSRGSADGYTIELREYKIVLKQ